MNRAATLGWLMFLSLSNSSSAQQGPTEQRAWLDELTGIERQETAASPLLRLIRQDHEKLEFGRSILKTPLTIGARVFPAGLGTHSVSHLQIRSGQPIARFTAWIGVDKNPRTQGGQGSVEFVVNGGDRELFRSEVMRGGQPAREVNLAITDLAEIDLHVTDASDGPHCDHANWCEAAIVTRSGRRIPLDEMALGGEQHTRRKYPFSFTYADKSSDTLLDGWQHERLADEKDKGLTVNVQRWVEPGPGLIVTLKSVGFQDYPARDWTLYFENGGRKDTAVIENVQAADLTFRSPPAGGTYRLHRTHGGPAVPSDFEPSLISLSEEHPVSLDPGHGRSSSKNFPFFKIDTRSGSAILAVGWSGMWKADFRCPDSRQLYVTAGLARTRFILHPRERVRGPRILLLAWPGDSLEANARFRELIYKHYAAKRDGTVPLPTLFCNTCFTRGGGWLNECNAQNQISLINAYAPLGLEALLTDAGWFEGGWPAGAGNWNPRSDAYPDGMAPIAAAAKDRGMIYGLWFEPERVVAGTDLHKSHPDWLLATQKKPQDTYLANFGLPEVQDYFFNIVKGFMELPGFRFYRQDFNRDPLPYWRHTDTPDRQGITEMKYIEGLYAYWDRIADTWPDSLREECASGGNRIDLETVRRMHLHQKTDYWFDNEADQGALWGLSQYLPNNTVVAHLNRMDDYSFHSTLPSSLCMGWIADAPDFDFTRGKKLLDRYLQVRHLLVGAWYPLLPYSRDSNDWIGSQYHRIDLDEGMLLVFRHATSPYRSVDVALRGLRPEATYALSSDGSGETWRARGQDLMRSMNLTIPTRHRSDLIVYRAVEPKAGNGPRDQRPERGPRVHAVDSAAGSGYEKAGE